MDFEKVTRLVILGELGRGIHSQYMAVVHGGDSASQQSPTSIKLVLGILGDLKKSPFQNNPEFDKLIKLFKGN